MTEQVEQKCLENMSQDSRSIRLWILTTNSDYASVSTKCISHNSYRPILENCRSDLFLSHRCIKPLTLTFTNKHLNQLDLVDIYGTQNAYKVNHNLPSVADIILRHSFTKVLTYVEFASSSFSYWAIISLKFGASTKQSTYSNGGRPIMTKVNPTTPFTTAACLVKSYSLNTVSWCFA